MNKIAMSITLILVILLSGCTSSDKILAEKMIEKYSENQNYVSLSGEIIEIEPYLITIKSEELKVYFKDGVCKFDIFSYQDLDLSVGDQIEFTTVIFYFYNGHILPIVEVKKGEENLLLFEDGKECLINWVKKRFG